jgi:hypothetical protein
MTMYTKREASDDPNFVEWVERVIEGVEKQFVAEQIYIVKVNNWFGQRWLGFSGKALGLVGVRNRRLTLPPFVPSRVVSQQRFLSPNARSTRSRTLHVRQHSEENLTRYADVMIHDATVFWYSSSTVENSRGSLMAYVLTPEGHWPWYVGLRRTGSWRVVEAVGISRGELHEFDEASG